MLLRNLKCPVTVSVKWQLYLPLLCSMTSFVAVSRFPKISIFKAFQQFLCLEIFLRLSGKVYSY